MSRRSCNRLSLVLLALQFCLLTCVALRNSVTFDETQHLPAGISYWQQGRFFAYHHNPPLSKLLFSIPAVVSGRPMDYSDYHYQPGDRHSDFLLAARFADRNAADYHETFVACRMVTVGWTLLGGWLIYVWGCRLTSPAAGLLGQTLWTFSPMVLAHGTLVTPDMAATVIGVVSTWLFWRFLETPTRMKLVQAAVGLGLAIGTKFTHILLPGVCVVLVVVRCLRSESEESVSWPKSHVFLDAILMVWVSLLTLNVVYWFEDSGMPPGRLELVSHTLTDPQNPLEADSPRINRFRHDFWKWCPSPFPRHFMLGLDHQLADVDSGDFENYLLGEFRIGKGWWHYYLTAFVVKTPIGLMFLILLAVAGLLMRPLSAGLLGTCALILPCGLTVWMLSRNSSLNVHSRYLLLVYPYLFLLTAIGITSLCAGSQMLRKKLVTVGVALQVISTLFVGPWPLTYFNEAVGGPRSGYQYLIDSNVDWGQGLIALRDWLNRRSETSPIQLAYFGAVRPDIYGINYNVPEHAENGSVDLRPGTHVISANYVAGSSFPPLQFDGTRGDFSPHGYQFYQALTPDDVIGHCLFVYEIGEDEVRSVSEWLENQPSQEAPK